MKLLICSLIVLSGLYAMATPTQTVRMISSNNYNISNSIGAIANNYNIKETLFVDSKSICRHLGIIKGSIDSVSNALRVDKELKRMAAFSEMNSKLAVLSSLVSQSTSYCGRNYAAEEDFNSKIEGDNRFMIAQMKLIVSTATEYALAFNEVDKCVNGQRTCN